MNINGIIRQATSLKMTRCSVQTPKDNYDHSSLSSRTLTLSLYERKRSKKIKDTRGFVHPVFTALLRCGEAAIHHRGWAEPAIHYQRRSSSLSNQRTLEKEEIQCLLRSVQLVPKLSV
ncbi:hypothetical protein YC2023_091235 [Brassica napus]